MKPIKLELQAFGPFVEKQTVDFEKLSEKGMFLIKGNTGSGKTTIFDAMTFALYGGSSGDEEKTRNGRNDLEEWRCTQADRNIDTYVALTFSVNDRKYLFKRILEQKRVNRTPKYEAGELDDDGNVIPLFSNPKKDDLTRKAEELIGLTKEQFRQVVMLPQGQFERFLTASSDEKEKILKKIFGAEQWERYAKLFFDKANEQKTALTDEKREIDSALADEAVSSIEALSEKIAAMKTERTEAEAAHIAFDGKKRQDDLNDDRLLSQQYKALHSIEAAGKALAEQKSAMDEKREHYAKSEKAESLRGVIDTFETAEGQAETRKRALEAQRAKLPDTEAVAEKAKRRKDEHEQSSPVEDLTKKIGEYEKKTEIYREYNVLTASFVTAKEEQLKAQAGNDSAKTALDSATKAAKDKKVDFDAADEKAGDYRDRYFAGIYGEIAQELIEGESCPVCGSKSHPRPAEKSVDSVSKEAMQEAQDTADKKKKAWTAAEKVRTEAETDFNAAAAMLGEKCRLLDQAQAKLDAAKKNLIEGIPDEGTLEKTIKALRAKIDKFNAETALLQSALTDASEKLTALNESIRSAEDESKKANEALKTATAELEKALTESEYPDMAVAKANMLSQEERLQLHKSIVEYDTSVENNRQDLETKKNELGGTTELDSALFDERQKEIDEEAKEFAARDAELRTNTDRLEKKLCALTAKSEHYKANIQQAESDLAFARKLRGDTGIGIQRYVLAVMFNQVIAEANRMLENVHGGRYRLFRTDEKGAGNKRGLELKVYDSRSPENKDGRGVAMLSGGEKFLVSLALSIGMSAIAQKTGVRIEALFIDEGFGTLDDSSINDAMTVLDSVRRTSGTIGIISHVQLLEATIPTHLEVVKKETGSTIVMC